MSASSTASQASPGPRTRIPAPAAIFTIAWPPPFMLFDAKGNAVTLGEQPPAEMEAVVHLSPRDLGGLRSYLLQRLHAIATSQRIEPADRAWAVHRALLYETSDTFRSIHDRVSLSVLGAVVREAALFQIAQPGTFVFLDVIFGSAYTPVEHAVDTALYASALAAADGVDDVDRLRAITMGALFADVAKLELSTEMLMRDGPLTEDEWRWMRDHPRRSAEIMRQAGVVVATALRGVLSHHERWDGSGYPERLRAGDIPYEARCIAIADSYSAMTVDRTFQARVDPFDALKEMSGGPKGEFDPSLLRTFVQLLGARQGTEQLWSAVA